MRLFRWSALALAGVTGGMLLGEMAAGTRLGSGMGEPATYSHLSANPDAAAPPAGGTAPCLDCRDSYGVAARLRADRESRMSNEFRDLGTVALDPPAPGEPDDGYRYGGRFPDPPPREASGRIPDAQVMPAGAAGANPPVAEALELPTDY
ncbi:MAG: hypothetical protein JHD35_18665 [Sphingopyxis sp.]|nr:hypothetical protein [Sphingopyxis sp.]